MACARCHDVLDDLTTGGPNLTEWEQSVSDGELVDSVLRPSKNIRRGYETLQVLLTSGRVVTGMKHSQTAEELTLRDPLTGQQQTISIDDFDEITRAETSVMPAAQVNQLTSRTQFLDLIRYLIEIRDGGKRRARELQPPPSMYAAHVAEYESRVDHSGMITELGDDAFARGEAIYNRLCINCHGDHDRPGSLPTALRFAEGRFRNGSDPHSMYRTLTHGFGYMVAQTWMVPQQKYDVVHYIRQAYLREHNPSQYSDITDEWLAGLPEGNTRGPEPTRMDRWATMDYGPRLINTYETGSDGSNFAYKGIAVRLDPGPGGIARGSSWMIFDHDTLRMSAAWSADPDSSERFIDWNGIHFNGRHGVHPRVTGRLQVTNPAGPGWAQPGTGSLDDSDRIVGRDGRRYGPLPGKWAKYRGVYSADDRTIIDYTVGATRVLEMPGMLSTQQPASPPIFTRTFHIEARTHDLELVVGTAGDTTNLIASGAQAALRDQDGNDVLQAGVTANSGTSQFANGLPKWSSRDGQLCLAIPEGAETIDFRLWFSSDPDAAGRVDGMSRGEVPNLLLLIEHGRGLWQQEITTRVSVGDSSGPFAIDHLTPPESNPWLAQTRLTGLDFLPDGDRMAVCCWDGDVWMVRGLRDLEVTRELHWQRIASGLFQPLGLKLVDGQIFVSCRDQIVILEDHNGDGETDYYRCFNNDHQVTEHFHEFAMGLQADDERNLYYAKSARHAKTALVPHHGTLLRVSPDGQQTEILANGFRAANGVCLNPDGTYVVTDQEGHWNPKNRINLVREGGFYGNMFGYHDVTDSSDDAMEQPLCWITNAFDRSPGELLWVDSESWGSLNGSLLNLSYGYGKVYVVPYEDVNGQPQGGMCELPIPQFPTGIMRGRFRPADGHLYACGMFAWAGSRSHPGGLYRLRATGKPSWLPRELQVRANTITIEFSDRLHPSAAEDVSNYQLKVWSLKRTADYGSDHYNERGVAVTAAAVSADGHRLTLTVPDVALTWCMEIRCQVKTVDGRSVERVIHNTIHNIGT